MLAGLFKAPSKYAPHVNIDQARARANVVLYRMLDSGFITQGELIVARRHPAEVVSEARLDSPGWFLDWAYRDTIDILEKNHLDHDYVIEVKTTIDTRLQRESQRIINAMLDTDAPPLNVTQAASVTMTPDGAVKAIIGGRDYEESQFNRATDAERQPGSSFKPFVYLNALLHGFTPTTVVIDTPVSINGWSPRNYTGKYAGRTTLTTALAQSYNSIPVQLMLKTGGVKAIIATARLAGLPSELEHVISLPLGTSAVTLMDITTGYATFAAGGVVAHPYTVTEIRRPNGELIYQREAPPRVQSVPEEKIAELNSMMNAVVTRGTGRRAFLGFTPQAGKTGTNQSYRDAWFIGFTAHNVTGVWVGNDDFSEMKKVTGGLLPAATWKSIRMEAERGAQPADAPHRLRPRGVGFEARDDVDV
jgi:penicillin-binding protein 1A